MLVLLACPETEAEQNGIALGSGEGVLSRRSRKTLADAMGALRDRHFDVLYCSDLPQAQDCLRSIRAHNPKIAARVEPREELRERSLGEHEGITYKELHQRLSPSEYRRWERDYFDTPPFGESLADVAERLMPLLEQLRRDFEARRDVLVLSHPDTIRVLIGALRGDQEEDVQGARIERAIPYWVHDTDRLIPMES